MAAKHWLWVERFIWGFTLIAGLVCFTAFFMLLEVSWAGAFAGLALIVMAIKGCFSDSDISGLQGKIKSTVGVGAVTILLFVAGTISVSSGTQCAKVDDECLQSKDANVTTNLALFLVFILYYSLLTAFLARFYSRSNAARRNMLILGVEEPDPIAI